MIVSPWSEAAASPLQRARRLTLKHRCFSAPALDKSRRKIAPGLSEMGDGRAPGLSVLRHGLFRPVLRAGLVHPLLGRRGAGADCGDGLRFVGFDINTSRAPHGDGGIAAFLAASFSTVLDLAVQAAAIDRALTALRTAESECRVALAG